MVQTILSALAPIVFTLLLGFVAAWRRDFGPKEASVLNRMVLLYAVPLALFVGTVGTPRAELVQDIALVVAIFAAIVGLYALVFLMFRFIFRFPLSESVLAALTASAPAVPFMGPAILGDLFGKGSAVIRNRLLDHQSRRPADHSRQSSWKRSKSRLSGRPCSLSCLCCAMSASPQLLTTDFHC
jgi:Membrane transport protein